MLTDIEIKFKGKEAFLKGVPNGDSRETLANLWERLFSPEAMNERRIEKGIYYGIGMENDVQMFGTSHEVIRSFAHYDDIQRILEEPAWYGIADDLDQIKEHFTPFIEDPDRMFFIQVMHYKKSEMQGQGWRWHKEGTYIGNQEPMAEHFGDEPEIEEVWHFHVIEVRPTD